MLTISLISAGMLLMTAFLKKSRAEETEIQKYKTIYSKDAFEIRFYPPAILASVGMNGNYDTGRNSGFRVLAGYIFGGNSDNRQIAMTAPVRMSTGEEENTMSFVLPSAMEYDHLPEPLNKNIVLHQSEATYATVIRYGGYSSRDKVESKKKELIAELEKLGLRYKDNFEFLGYNAPYDTFNRRNEVWVELLDFDPATLGETVAGKTETL